MHLAKRLLKVHLYTCTWLKVYSRYTYTHASCPHLLKIPPNIYIHLAKHLTSVHNAPSPSFSQGKVQCICLYTYTKAASLYLSFIHYTYNKRCLTVHLYTYPELSSIYIYPRVFETKIHTYMNLNFEIVIYQT